MKTKSIVTPLLLLFVIGSVAYLVVDETRSRETTPAVASPGVADASTSAAQTRVAPTAESTSVDAGAGTSGLADASAPAPEPRHTTIAYYFHSTQRCKTCLAIERQAHDALADAFAAELASGALEWHAVNTDEPANEHFVDDYALVASSLVLVDRQDDADASWINLDKVWDLVHDEPAFARYVVNNTRLYLEP
ncbi:MAG TPA: nitrophenyl compound nitroreductase subunit ArsF family protein [Phycisphaerae bacterium]|nr:nitrophenyl compound nitroreductase subunit ArsF family protein [Phycisphaerae bacterium]